MRLSSLAKQTLPALHSIETAIDLRLDFEGAEVGLVVPTVIAYLRTDHRSTNAFFQMGKSDVEQLVGQLTKVLERIRHAEAWAKERQ